MDGIYGSLNRCRVDVWRDAVAQIEDVPLWTCPVNDLVHPPTDLVVGCMQGLRVQISLNRHIAKYFSCFANVDSPVERIGVCLHFP